MTTRACIYMIQVQKQYGTVMKQKQNSNRHPPKTELTRIVVVSRRQRSRAREILTNAYIHMMSGITDALQKVVSNKRYRYRVNASETVVPFCCFFTMILCNFCV